MVCFLQLLIQIHLLTFTATEEGITVVTKQASRGERVDLIWDEIKKPQDIIQLRWLRESYVYARFKNQTWSNFSTKFEIFPNSPRRLTIKDFQEEHAGIYKCELSDTRGFETRMWSVTLREKNDTEVTSPESFLHGPLIYSLFTVAEVLFIFASAACLSRICRLSKKGTGQDISVQLETI